MQILRCRCERINEKGQGVGYTQEGIPIFASNWLIGEEAQLEVLAVKQTYIFAVVRSLLNHSPFREIPFCEHFGKCGGCQLQHLNQGSQRELKGNFLNEYWSKKELLSPDIEWIEGPGSGYRTKLILPIEWEDSAPLPKVGFYQIHSRKLEPIRACKVHTPSIEKIIKEAPNWFYQWVKGWPKALQEGDPWKAVHFLYARQVDKEGPIHLALGLKKPLEDETWANRFLECAPKELLIHGISSITQKKTLSNVWFEGDVKREIGAGGMKLSSSQLFEIDPFAFQQVNPEMANLIKNQIRFWIEELQPKNILELYCGAGVLANTLSKETQVPIIGVDNLEANIISAKKNALKMDSKARFYCDDAFAWVKNNAEKRGAMWLLNPPRKGLGKDLIDLIKQQKPRYLIYMACGQKALAEDAHLLKESYKLVKLKAYDMFAQTMHFETLSLWKRES